MMMPANYSAIAENEMSYVVGGGLLDVLVDPMTAAQWKQLNTNVVTLIGNTFAEVFVQNTLGELFDGKYVFGEITKTYGNYLSGLAHNGEVVDNQQALTANGVMNAGLNVVAALATVYTLGFNKVAAKLPSTIF